MTSQEQAEQLDRALAAAQRAVAANGSSAQSWHDLGVLHQQRGDLADSFTAFRRAVDLDPSSASAHNNLGNTYMRMGDNERAVQSYRRAIERDPQLMAAHANAAAALHVLGRNAEALVHARRAVEIEPASSPARITAAFIDGAVSGYEVALAQIDELLTREPENPSAIAARGYCLLRLERYEEALTTARAGLALRPNYGLFIESLGCALRGLGRSEEAFAAFDRAFELGHDRAAILVLKASGLLEIGRMQEARRALEAALEITPDLPSAWNTLAELLDFAPGDPALARMESFLANSPNLRGLEARVLMHFALGKAYRKTGDSQNAFHHFAAGNALRRGTIDYDVADDERFAADTIAFFTPDKMRAMSGAGDDSRAPIFVLGMPRSGTSLVEQILASHPDVHGAGELLLFDRAIADVGADDLSALGARYLALVDEIAPATKRVVDKLPSNFRHVGLLHLALPRARFVHTTRDALDTCFSCYTTNFSGRQDFSWNLAECGRYYRAYEALTAHWHAILAPGIMLDIAYEDVVADVESSARALLAFCGLPWDDAVLRFYETARPIRTASYKQARQPIYTSSVKSAGSYRAHLQPLIDALGV